MAQVAQQKHERSMTGWLAAAAVVLALAAALAFNLFPSVSAMLFGSTAWAEGKPASAEAAAPADGGAVTSAQAPSAADLAQKQAQLDTRAADLKAQEAVVAGLAQTLASKQAAAGSVERVAQFYSAMPPTKAAAILEGLDDAAVVAILQAIDPEQAGMVLAAMSPGRSAQITTQLMKPVPPVTAP